MGISYCAMENAVSQLVMRLNAEQFAGATSALGLLSDGAQMRFEREAAVPAADCFAKIQAALGARTAFLFTASPAYTVREDGSGMITCDVYAYIADPAKKTCFLKIMRADVTMVEAQGVARPSMLNCYTIQTMLPWTYTGSEPAPGPVVTLAAPFFGVQPVAAADYLALKKLNNRPWDRLRQNIEDLFCDPAQAADFAATFAAPDKKRPTVVVSGMPTVQMTDAAHAQVLSLVETFMIKPSADFSESGEAVERLFCQVRLSAVKQGESWKIADYTITPVFCLPDTAYIQGIRYDRAAFELDNWPFFNPAQPGVYEEDSYAVENVLNAWVFSLRRGDLGGFARKYMNHPDLTPVLCINGKRNSIPSTGLDQITQRLDGMDRGYMQSMISYHNTTTPVIEISADGQTARGTWFDHSATNMRSAHIRDIETDAEIIPYMIFIARYVHEFKKLDGKWYLSNFFWEPLINLDDWTIDYARSGGFVEWGGETRYPWAFDTLD